MGRCHDANKRTTASAWPRTLEIEKIAVRSNGQQCRIEEMGQRGRAVATRRLNLQENLGRCDGEDDSGSDSRGLSLFLSLSLWQPERIDRK